MAAPWPLLWPLAAALVGAIALAFHGVPHLPFIGLDDPDYVTQNLAVRAGLTPDSIRWAFVGVHAGNWHPVTWLSHMADATLFGVDPVGHHLVNLALHGANALLVFALFARLTGSRWRSALLAALFAVHPLRVESVAWVAERKDLLAGFFWFATTLAYVSYVRRPGRARYATMLALFVLGLMSKPMLVTLPATLLLLDAWPLSRLDPARLSWQGLRPLVLEKTPLFALSAASSAVTIFAQSEGGAVQSFSRVPLVDRLLNAPMAIVGYIGKSIWPSSLAVFYPFPETRPSAWLALGAASAVTVATVFAWRAWRRFPWVAVGWLWFLGTLVPVIGLVQVGGQAMADRYTYVPSVGLALIVAWSLPFPRWRGMTAAAAVSVAAVAVVALLGVATARQVDRWSSEIELFDHTLSVTGRNWLAENIVGVNLERRGDDPGALIHYRRALEIRPHSPEALNNLGALLFRNGEAAAGLSYLAEAVRQGPRDPVAARNLGASLCAVGRLAEGYPFLTRAVALAPADPTARYNLGLALLELGRERDALAEFEAAARLNPGDPDARHQVDRLRPGGRP